MRGVNGWEHDKVTRVHPLPGVFLYLPASGGYVGVLDPKHQTTRDEVGSSGRMLKIALRRFGWSTSVNKVAQTQLVRITHRVPHLSNEARPLAGKVNAVAVIELEMLDYTEVCFGVHLAVWAPLPPVSGFVFFLLAAVPRDVVLFLFAGLLCQIPATVCSFSGNSLLGVVFHTVDIYGQSICQMATARPSKTSSAEVNSLRSAGGSTGLLEAVANGASCTRTALHNPLACSKPTWVGRRPDGVYEGRLPPGEDVDKEVITSPSLG
ncbi:hypothetical protein EDC04DRAFT_2610602 [Pisolithus marmoratus]|nr:hypothetical protein EDC04DRAFT_2610602 [Pisolithus marmoratus]